VKYAFIAEQRAWHSIAMLCRVLGVSRSGYYDWRNRKPSRRALENQKLLEIIRQQHIRTKRALGALKMYHHLKALGVTCGKHRVARLRSNHGLEARRKARFRAKYVARQGASPAPQLVTAPFHARHADEIWVGDVTFIPTSQGWLYLAILLDLFSRKVVGWAMRSKADTELTLGALDMALAQRAPTPGLIHHSDQGTQYNNGRYRDHLIQHDLVASMSRKGNCYDNAVAESFFSSLKNELVHGQLFRTRDQARCAIFEYIEAFYNRVRPHQSLGYRSPASYETMQAVA
jgi:transposase InsO family protein